MSEDIVVYRLREIGLNVKSIWDLVNSRLSYPIAIPLLVDFLKEGSIDDNLNEGIVRALAVKEAKGKANETLLNLYTSTDKGKNMLRWAIGNTMNVIMTNADEQAVLDIISDKENGTSRQMFVMGAYKLRSQKVESVLIELLNDDEVSAHAISAVGRLKAKNALPVLNTLLNHPKAFIRKEAAKAIARITK